MVSMRPTAFRRAAGAAGPRSGVVQFDSTSVHNQLTAATKLRADLDR
jgi:hypothetical protein